MTLKLKWSERYNIYRAKIGVISLIVAWKYADKDTPSHYAVSLSGDGSRVFDQQFRDVKEAQEFAESAVVDFAKAILAKMTDEAQS